MSCARRRSVGLSASGDTTKQVESLAGVAINAGRRSVVKGGLSLGIMALWQPLEVQEKNMLGSKKGNSMSAVLSYEDVRSVAPALEQYTSGPLLNGVWKSPGLSPRDRSVVTVAALIARMQTIEMPYHFALALDNGVKPAELSEIITHLAFYAGWANAMSGVAVAKDIFHQRGIGLDQLPPAKEKLLPLNDEDEKRRATQVESNFGRCLAGPGAEHDGYSLPRSLAASCPVSARQKFSHCKRTDCQWANRTDHISPRARDGQRSDARASRRDVNPHRLLRGLALRFFRAAHGERGVRETEEVILLSVPFQSVRDNGRNGLPHSFSSLRGLFESCEKVATRTGLSALGLTRGFESSEKVYPTSGETRVDSAEPDIRTLKQQRMSGFQDSQMVCALGRCQEQARVHTTCFSVHRGRSSLRVPREWRRRRG